MRMNLEETYKSCVIKEMLERGIRELRTIQETMDLKDGK